MPVITENIGRNLVYDVDLDQLEYVDLRDKSEVKRSSNNFNTTSQIYSFLKKFNSITYKKNGILEFTIDLHYPRATVLSHGPWLFNYERVKEFYKVSR